MIQRDLLDHLIAIGPTVFFRRTITDDVTFVTPNAERVLGYPCEEILTTPGFWASKVHPDDLPAYLARAERAFASRETELEREYRFLHNDGRYRWLHAKVFVEYAQDGAPEFLSGHAIDVTDRRNAEEQSSRLWHFPLSLAFIAGLDGLFKRVSAGYEQLLGWSRQEMLARPFVEFVHPDDLGALGTSLQGIMAGGEAVLNQEIRVAHKDGSYRWLLGNYSLDVDEGLLYGLAVDITPRKETEEALRHNAKRTRLIIDSASDAFVSIDVDGRIVDWNAEAEQVFGWSADEVTGRMLADTIVPERYRDAHRRGLERYRTTGEGPLLGRRFEIEALRRDSSEIPVELTISPARIDGEVIFNAFLHDVSERKRAEEALVAANAKARRAREEAETANRAKSDFLSRMSHELRTPLTAVIGFGELLAMDDLTDDQHESVERIVRAGRHLLELINEVLDVARIEQGQIALSIEPVNLDQVIRESHELVRPLAGASEVAMPKPPSFGVHVLADGQRLKQVLMNLLSNAVKYNVIGGTVTVSRETAAAGRIRVAVTDTGRGIPPEKLDRLFRPFERLGADRTDIEGTGIGLSICKRLVEMMGGEIGVISEPGKGSTFWLDFVEAFPPDVDVPQGMDRAARPDGIAVPEQTILYVEDNLSNLRLVERVLSRRPATRLIAAMQGGLALELVREHGPDVILLDVHLPDMEGDEVLRRLKADPDTRGIPVVMVSAEATPGRIRRYIEAGARAYITKPLDLSGFLDLVNEVLAEAEDEAGVPPG